MSGTMTPAGLSSCAERVNAPLSDDPTVHVQGPVWAGSHFIVFPLLNHILYHSILFLVSRALFIE